MVHKKPIHRLEELAEHACKSCETNGRVCVASEKEVMKIMPRKKREGENIPSDEVGFWVNQ